jgi:type II secretory pathway pseudopilin PulG
MHQVTEGRKQRQDSGFTLVEVLASLMFLAILVPAVVSALSLSSRISELSGRRAVAVELAENQLNEELMANNWMTGNSTKGDFGTGYLGYTWEMTQSTWSGDTLNSMTELAMEVTFPVQGRPQKVRLTTLVSQTVAQQALNSGTTAPTASSPAAAAAPAAPSGGGGRPANTQKTQ